MIKKCEDTDFETILQIINDGASAYDGVIPEDCWHDPYMRSKELEHEITDGVVFWGYGEGDRLMAVMGIQDRGHVTLIRHAYVRTSQRNRGIGGRLLRFLEAATTKPILIGTWSAATWAIAFYKKNGYRCLNREETARLLRTYWTISERQLETSVVLAKK